MSTSVFGTSTILLLMIQIINLTTTQKQKKSDQSGLNTIKEHDVSSMAVDRKRERSTTFLLTIQLITAVSCRFLQFLL